MTPASRRLLSVLGLGLLAALSLRPVGPVERAIDLAFLPARWVAELALPARWLAAGELRAAERRSLAHVEAEAREVAALLEAEQRHALPPAALLADRSVVHGEVVRRHAASRDRVVVRLATLEGIERGMPVVAGEHLVGRVESLLEDSPGQALVALVTAADVFVGAQALEDPGAGGALAPPAYLVVGGLAPRVDGDPQGAIFLAVHNPSRHSVLEGEVRVLEPAALDDPFAPLARGFRLGALEPVLHPGGGLLRRVRPGLDYKGGLYQVLVLRPGAAGPPEERLALDTLDPANWRRVRSLGGAGVARGRAGHVLAVGAWTGARGGAALASGAWLVGRLERVSPLTSGVRLLSDAGLRVPVLARIEGLDRPLALGELVSLGGDGAGLLRLRWDATLGLAERGVGIPDLPGGTVVARLYTGSGHEGVPRGLLIGDALLPTGRGRHALSVERDPAHDAVRDPWLWRPAAGGAQP